MTLDERARALYVKLWGEEPVFSQSFTEIRNALLAVQQAERERCAKICQDQADRNRRIANRPGYTNEIRECLADEDEWLAQKIRKEDGT